LFPGTDPDVPIEENPTLSVRSAELVGIMFLTVTNFDTLGKEISKGADPSAETVTDAVINGIPLI
jgi:hypothetical protein